MFVDRFRDVYRSHFQQLPARHPEIGQRERHCRLCGAFSSDHDSVLSRIQPAGRSPETDTLPWRARLRGTSRPSSPLPLPLYNFVALDRPHRRTQEFSLRAPTRPLRQK